MIDQDATIDAPKAGSPYRVLARKYRPRRFEDLVGQDAMTRVLRNAFARGRIAHAFILTGVRGVGKTTTARILARALNFEKGADRAAGPTLDLAEDGDHCAAIAEGRHPDVMEMDAASRTGVADIRELIEGVRYAPVSARYKVYIIDEVHMLSTAAFNGLLKTLEEPPPHVKFIFATTEIQKVPVTVLSRCQRFDLRRVGPDLMIPHLNGIAKAEGAAIDEEAATLIARASEGSVRDALSLLDQALAESGETGAILGADVRAMLGLADRGRALDLFEALVTGRPDAALAIFDDLHQAGADVLALIRDLMEIAHRLTRLKLSDEAAKDPGEPADRMARLKALSESLNLGALARLWKMLLAGLEDVRAAPDAGAAAEMVLVRIGYAGTLPDPDDLHRLIKGDGGAARQDASSEPSTPAAAAPSSPAGPQAHGKTASRMSERRHGSDAQEVGRPAPRDLPAIAELARAHRDLRLLEDIRRHVRPVAVAPGRLTFRPTPDAPGDLAGRLKERLDAWTGAVWAVTVSMEADGAPTLAEEARMEIEAARKEALDHPIVKAALDVFDGAELVVGAPIAEPVLERLESAALESETEADEERARRHGREGEA